MEPKIYIAIPHMGGIQPEVFLSLTNMDKPANATVVFSSKVPLEEARNDLVQLALDGGADYILFYDGDVAPPKEALNKLMENIDKADFITGIVFKKQPPFLPLIYKRAPTEKTQFSPLTSWDRNEFLKIDGCGLGFALINMEVFKKLPKPWFKFTDVSEDFTLCLRIAEMGYSVYCDTRVLCRHLGTHPFSMVDFENALIVRQLFLNGRVKHLTEFLGAPEQECYTNILSGQDILAAEWREKNPKTPEEIMEFYKTTKNYLFDLSMGDFLHYEDRRRWIYRICALGDSVLDFGGGVGTYTCWLAERGLDVSYADVDGVTRNFAMFSAEKNGLKDKITWFKDKPWEEAPDKKYEVIVALEVLEHVADFQGTVKHLWDMLEPGGFLIATYAEKNDTWPMHLLTSFRQFIDVLTLQGFEGFENNIWIKPKQG